MFRNSMKLFKELANEFKQSEERFQEGKEKHEEKKRKIREQKKRSENHQSFIETLVRGHKQRDKNCQGEEINVEGWRPNLRVYAVRRIYERKVYKFPKGLTDMGGYMKATEYEDQDGNRLYVGDVVRVRGCEDVYSIIVHDKETFVMGFAASSIEDMDITKIRDENTILKVYKERDFIVGDIHADNLIKHRSESLEEYARLLADDTDNALEEGTKRNIKVKL